MSIHAPPSHTHLYVRQSTADSVFSTDSTDTDGSGWGYACKRNIEQEEAEDLARIRSMEVQDIPHPSLSLAPATAEVLIHVQASGNKAGDVSLCVRMHACLFVCVCAVVVDVSLFVCVYVCTFSNLISATKLKCLLPEMFRYFALLFTHTHTRARANKQTNKLLGVHHLRFVHYLGLIAQLQLGLIEQCRVSKKLVIACVPITH